MKNLEEWCLENNELEELKLYNNAQNKKKSNEIPFSGRDKVNWKCDKCGIEWTQSTNSMSRRPKKVCPYCMHERTSYFYNLGILYPMLQDEWNYEKNKNKPEEYTPNSQKRVWWKCRNGHEWQARIKDRRHAVERNLKEGRPICPYCNHKKTSNNYNLLTEFPHIARQWNYLKNGKLTPIEVSPKSQQKVWWLCDFNSNHEWQDRISNRTMLNRKCPICSREFTISFPARAIFYYLKQFFNDCEMEYRVLSKYVLDIFIPSAKIAIEYDGWYYHSDKAAQNRESKKDKLLQENELEVIRIKEQKEESKEIIVDNNIIKYYLGENYKNTNIDKLIKVVIKLIEVKTKRNLVIDVDVNRDRQKIESLYYHVRKSNTLAVKYPELAEEWSNENETKPDTINCGSNNKVKWVCRKCNRTFECSVYNRVRNKSNCPFCSNRKVTEENSLYSNYPDIAKEWNYEKNNGLTPKDVTLGSDKTVWWKCQKGHEWQMKVYIRTGRRKGKCPYCSHRKLAIENSLEVRNPELKKIWNYEKNSGKTPQNYSYSSNVVVWWKCEKGHEWKMRINGINQIKSESKCPYCRGIKLCKDNSLAVVNKALSAEWNYDKNAGFNPEDILSSSTKKVWWKCSKNHEWKAAVNVRNRGTSCPFCASVRVCKENSFAENEKELLQQWDYEKNGELKPNQISRRSSKKIWWKCEKGHSWQDTISHRKEGRRCPYCYGRLKEKTV